METQEPWNSGLAILVWLQTLKGLNRSRHIQDVNALWISSELSGCSKVNGSLKLTVSKDPRSNVLEWYKYLGLKTQKKEKRRISALL